MFINFINYLIINLASNSMNYFILSNGLILTLLNILDYKI